MIDTAFQRRCIGALLAVSPAALALMHVTMHVTPGSGSGRVHG